MKDKTLYYLWSFALNHSATELLWCKQYGVLGDLFISPQKALAWQHPTNPAHKPFKLPVSWSKRESLSPNHIHWSQRTSNLRFTQVLRSIEVETWALVPHTGMWLHNTLCKSTVGYFLTFLAFDHYLSTIFILALCLLVLITLTIQFTSIRETYR